MVLRPALGTMSTLAEELGREGMLGGRPGAERRQGSRESCWVEAGDS